MGTINFQNTEEKFNQITNLARELYIKEVVEMSLLNTENANQATQACALGCFYAAVNFHNALEEVKSKLERAASPARAPAPKRKAVTSTQPSPVAPPEQVQPSTPMLIVPAPSGSYGIHEHAEVIPLPDQTSTEQA